MWENQFSFSLFHVSMSRVQPVWPSFDNWGRYKDIKDIKARGRGWFLIAPWGAMSVTSPMFNVPPLLHDVYSPLRVRILPLSPDFNEGLQGQRQTFLNLFHPQPAEALCDVLSGWERNLWGPQSQFFLIAISYPPLLLWDSGFRISPASELRLTHWTAMLGYLHLPPQLTDFYQPLCGAGFPLPGHTLCCCILGPCLC